MKRFHDAQALPHAGDEEEGGEAGEERSTDEVDARCSNIFLHSSY